MPDYTKKDSVFVVCIGTNGTGKSTVLRKIAEAAYGNRRVLVLPSNPAEPSFKDIPPVSIDKLLANPNWGGIVRVQLIDETDFERVVIGLHDCVLISDDFRNYISSTRLKRNMRKLLIERRHKKIDIYMAAHGFTHLPPEFVQFADAFFLFRTVDNPLRHRDKYLNPKRMLETVMRVNQLAAKDKYYYEVIDNE